MSPALRPVAPVAVLGVGNVLARDDAFGPSVVWRVGRGVAAAADLEVLDVGTAGLDLVDYLVGRQAVILVDTVAVDRPPGSLLELECERILAGVGRGARISPHQPAIADSLQVAALAGDLPESVWLVGVVPEDLSPGTGLSEPVAAGLGPAVALVLARLRDLGVVTDTSRTEVGDPPWWESERLDPACVSLGRPAGASR